MLSIALPDDVEDRLDALARETGQTKAAVALEAILDHLEDLEDRHTAEHRLADVRAGLSRPHTLDEVERDLGLAN